MRNKENENAINYITTNNNENEGMLIAKKKQYGRMETLLGTDKTLWLGCIHVHKYTYTCKTMTSEMDKIFSLNEKKKKRADGVFLLEWDES